jgi:exodeoxyribonuclease VII large subunit
MPSCRIILCPVAVQGPGAEREIADGIRQFNEFGQVDVIIVGRGGGSLEDLWAFNEEIVARAIHASDIPVISAVGHQVDYTISDFAADVRAPTPSAAAEMAVSDSKEVGARIDAVTRRLQSGIDSTMRLFRTRVERASQSYVLRRPEGMLANAQQTVDDLSSRLVNAVKLKIERHRARMQLLIEKSGALSPKAVLQRGYAVCRTYPELGIVRRFDQVRIGDRVKIELSAGSIMGAVDGIAEE